jgi:hypothetical protein
MARFVIGDTVCIPVRIRASARHPAAGYVAVKVALPGYDYPLWLSTADFTGSLQARVTVRDFRLWGGLVQVEATIGGLRQLIWLPRWAVRRAPALPTGPFTGNFAPK